MSCISQVDELSKTSPFAICEKVPEADDAISCSDCMDSQSCQLHEDKEDRRASQKRHQTQEQQHDSTDPDITEQSDIGKKMKHANKAIKLKDEHLDMLCQWRGCDYRTCLIHHFVLHVSLHIPQAERRLNENKEGIGFVVFPHHHHHLFAVP
jgi:hypothetical protein